MPGPTIRTKKFINVWAAVVLLWLLFAQAVRGAVISSFTFDEGPHLAVGYATLRTGDLRLQPVHIHPPLINVLAAAPLLLDPSLPDPRTIDGWEIASLSAVTDTVIWQHRPPDGLALAGRVPIILLAVLLGAFVYRWATDLAGLKAGLIALFLYALDPNIIAHAQVVTTDMGVTVFGFMALYFYFRFQTLRLNLRSSGQASNLQHQNWWLIGAGVALGAALAAKVSAGLLVPLMVIIVLFAGPGTITRRVQHLGVIGLVAFVTLWAAYGFEIGRVPGIPIPVPAATHIKIYQSLLQHYDEGHPAFLMGMNSTRGWWYYFLVAFLVKTPLPTLILLILSTALGVRYWRPGIGDWKKSSVWTLGLFPIVHFATAQFSSVDIGYRHLLPILPFLFVFIGARISNFKFKISDLSPRHLVALSPCLLASALLAWYTINAALIFPHNLTFFNELAGGPDNGYNWLVDSNLDWGQNLKELKAYLDVHNVSQVFVSQFSPARPEVYGIQATMLPPSPRAGAFARFNPAPGWYAIGATTLQGVYTPDVDTFAYFRAMAPTARIGHALFIYHVPEQPRGEWVAQCASPTPPLNADEIKAGFGRSDLRLVQFDCSASWWYPASGEPGWYVHTDLPREGLAIQKWYPSAYLIYQPRREQIGNGGVYRVDRAMPPSDQQRQAVAAPGDWPPAQVMSQGVQMTAPVSTTGPLRFEGYQLYATQIIHPGGTAVVFTAWRVTHIPEAPLSIMAHLLDSQGRVVTTGDGLGVPIEVWQTGDVIMQAHQLNMPADLAPGTYWVETGVYWLDTMERYHILQNNQAVGDRLMLAPINVEAK